MLLSFNDICIVPSIISNIESRSECCPYIEDKYNRLLPFKGEVLPLFTAPMSSVINETNWEIFKNNKINTIIPRTVDWEIRTKLASETFIAVSLVEFERIINYWRILESEFIHICVDIANGHMKKLLDLCKEAKRKFGNQIVLMTGNIANPDTYFEYAKVGIDFVRAGIGNGSACTTASNVSVNYGMVSLLQELRKNKWAVTRDIALNDSLVINNCEYQSIPEIIADGGFSNFDQIIKALALGADYVMLGKIFAMSEEACGEIVHISPDKQMRKYYGMSTKKAQSEFGNTVLKTAEGIETLVPIKYTLAGWCDNFISYLRSAMSYCNSKNLDEFKKNTTIKQISNNSFNSYFK